MICRCRDDRSRRSASPPLTLSSSPVFDASEVPADFSRRTIATTIARHTSMTPAPISIIVREPTDSDQERGQPCAHRAAEAGAAADEPEDALGLARIVDVVGERPELADQQDRQDLHDDVERDRDPVLADEREQAPEQEQHDDDADLRHRNHRAARHQGDRLGVALHDDADRDAQCKGHPRQLVGAEAVDELGLRDRLDDVVARHRQERVQEHQQPRRRLRRRGVVRSAAAGGPAMRGARTSRSVRILSRC